MGSPRILSNLNIQRFRGLRDLELRELAPVTILTGRNGCGKTSVLEAAFLLCGLSNATLALSLATFRGVPAIPGVDTAFRVLLPDFGEGGTARIEGKTGRQGGEARLTLEIAGTTAAVGAGPTTEPKARLVGLEFRASSPSGRRTGFVGWETPPAGAIASIELGPLRIEQGIPGLRTDVKEDPDVLPARFVRPQPHAVMAELHVLLTELVKRAETVGVLELVQLVAPAVRGIQPLVERGQPMIYVDIGKKQLDPAQILGGGFVNILQIATFICDEASRLLLIDEIEDGLHYSVMDRLAHAVITFARERGKQFVIATHSRDVVSAFGEVATQTPDAVTFFKLHRRNETIAATPFAVDEWKSIEDIGGEIR